MSTFSEFRFRCASAILAEELQRLPSHYEVSKWLKDNGAKLDAEIRDATTATAIGAVHSAMGGFRPESD